MTTRRSPATQRRIPIRLVSGATTYNFLALPEVQVVLTDDSPAIVPITGEIQAKSRRYHNVVSIKAIVDAFAHQVEMRFEDHHGIIDHLSDSNVDTRDGTIRAAPLENNPSSPTAVGISWVAGPSDGNNRPSTVSTTSLNPKSAIFFAGTSKSGVFTWRVDDVALNNYDLDVLRWDGTAWQEEATIVSGSVNEQLVGRDMVIHKGALCFLYQTTGAAGTVTRSTDGDTFSDMTNSPSGTNGPGEGSRLISDQNDLIGFIEGRTTAGAFDIVRTRDNGATAWVVMATNLSGQIVDVALYYDTANIARIVILTLDALYWLNTSGSAWTIEQLYRLPARGRAMIQLRDELLVFMDGMQVEAYSQNGARRSMSPGGIQGMPSGKDFGFDVQGRVCVYASADGTYALWSGDDTGGTDQKPLCLFTRGEGWHYIWQKADTSISSAARFVVLDPVSGDLLMAVQDAVSEATTLVRLKDIEVPPGLQGTLDRNAAAQTFTTPRLDFGSPIVPTTIWDAFLHTSGLGTGKSLAVAYRTDGSTGAFTAVATVTADRTRVIFPDNTTTGAGLNFRDVQLQFTLDPNAVTDAIQVYSIDIGYARIWPVRRIYVMDLDLNARARGIPSAKQARTNLDTIEALTTKALLSYADVSGKSVLPIPPMHARELIGDTAVPQSNPRASIYRLTLLEA